MERAVPDQPGRPTKAELQAAKNKSVPDVIAHNLKVLFVGINPGLYTAAIGHHFGRPGNRFWPALYRAGFTPRLLAPHEEQDLIGMGYGITNLVNRATAAADELSAEELERGGRRLEAAVREYQPRFVAVLGVGAYRSAFGRPHAGLGLQPERVGDAPVWVLPNPSGLNAHYQLDDLARLFQELRETVEREPNRKEGG
jgi:TDG/mug DNA glycosylase family protein